MTARPAEHALTSPRAEELRRARRALLIVGLVLPAAIAAVACALILVWMPELPDPAAVHWGVAGVDRLGSPLEFVALALLLGMVLPLALVGTVLGLGRGQWGGAARLLGAVALGLSGLGALIATGSVALQRGLSDAAQAGPIWPVAVGGFCALLVLTAAGWVLQPDVRPTPAVTLEPARLASISAGERIVWIGTASMPRGGQAGIAVIAVVLTGITAVMMTQAHIAFWIPLLVLAIIGFAFAATASFVVRAGAEGLTVRSRIGWPHIQVALSDIVAARAVQCHPFAEFGGFGWRTGVDGRTGIVLRTGPALEVQRRGKKALVVTVDGAEVAAATLQAHLDRRDGTAPTR